MAYITVQKFQQDRIKVLSSINRFLNIQGNSYRDFYLRNDMHPHAEEFVIPQGRLEFIKEEHKAFKKEIADYISKLDKTVSSLEEKKRVQRQQGKSL